MTQFSIPTAWLASFAIGSLLLASGCGGPAKPTYPTIKLSGTVKVHGVPVEQGRIRFGPTGANQAPAAEAVVTEGKYAVENAPVGNVVVTFIGTKKTGRQIESYGKQIDQNVNIIPANYSRGIPVTLNASGTGDRNFDLTSN